MFENGLPVPDMTALGCNKFKVVGELMAASIVQGGPAPCFLYEVAYLYLSDGVASITNEKWYPNMKDKSLLGAIDKVRLLARILHLFTCTKKHVLTSDWDVIYCIFSTTRCCLFTNFYWDSKNFSLV